MRALIIIISLTIGTGPLKCQTLSFADKLVFNVFRDSCALTIKKTEVAFRNAGCKELEIVDLNLFLIPTELDENIVDSLILYTETDRIAFEAHIVNMANLRNGMISMNLKAELVYDCSEITLQLGDVIHILENSPDCKNILKIYLNHPRCIVKSKGRYVEDCNLQEERNQYNLKGTPAKY